MSRQTGPCNSVDWMQGVSTYYLQLITYHFCYAKIRNGEGHKRINIVIINSLPICPTVGLPPKRPIEKASRRPYFPVHIGDEKLSERPLRSLSTHSPSARVRATLLPPSALHSLPVCRCVAQWGVRQFVGLSLSGICKSLTNYVGLQMIANRTLRHTLCTAQSVLCVHNRP